MNINLREPSTKRGIVMIITGCTVLYQTIWGSGPVNIEALFSRVDWWLGVGLNAVGILGLLPDRDPEQRTRETDVQPIELQSRSELPEFDADRMKLNIPPDHRTTPELEQRGSDPSWHGFNDQ